MATLSRKKTAQTSKTVVGTTRKIRVPKKSSGNENSNQQSYEMEASFREIGTQTSKTGCVVRTLKAELINVFGEESVKPKPVIEEPLLEHLPICKDLKRLSKTKRLKLRSAWQTHSSDTVGLKQFDPNFRSSKYICCRSPGCRQRKLRSRGKKKEDLYLCPSHRKSLEENVEKICAKVGVGVSSKHCSEDFEGYTSIIGLLEAAFNNLSQPKQHFQSKFGKSAGMVHEVCLNIRNFLIIVNALLNPDEENLCTALNQPMAMLVEILRILRDDGEVIVQRVRELVDILRVVLEHILFAFGVIYSWIYLSLVGNPGAKVGAGVGGFVGMAGLVLSGPIGVFTTLTGAVFGGLFGSGIYDLWNAPQRDMEEAQERLRRYQEFAQANHMAALAEPELQDEEDEQGLYYITGSSTGDLLLALLLGFGLF